MSEVVFADAYRAHADELQAEVHGVLFRTFRCSCAHNLARLEVAA